jgi:hypothetical protein
MLDRDAASLHDLANQSPTLYKPQAGLPDRCRERRCLRVELHHERRVLDSEGL